MKNYTTALIEHFCCGEKADMDKLRSLLITLLKNREDTGEKALRLLRDGL